MIKDQALPKWSGHVSGIAIVNFYKAVERIEAAYDARDKYSAQFSANTDLFIVARTDALKTGGFDEAIRRCIAFRDVGANVTFLEALLSIQQAEQCYSKVLDPKLAK